MAIIIFLEFIANYLEATLRGIKKFSQISKYQLCLIPIALLTLLFPLEYNFIGLCIRAILISFLKLLILLILTFEYLSMPKFQMLVLKNLFNLGWRLWIWNYLKNLIKSFPRLIIVTFSGSGLLGLYAPVNWINMAFTSLSGSISAYIYPNLSHNLAKKDSNIGQQALYITKYTLIIFLPMTILGIFLLPYIIPWLLPKYIVAISAMQVSLVAGLFESINLATTAFATLKAWKVMFTHIFISIALKGILILNFYFMFDNKLLGVATGICIASILMFGITWRMVSLLDKPSNANI